MAADGHMAGGPSAIAFATAWFSATTPVKCVKAESAPLAVAATPDA